MFMVRQAFDKDAVTKALKCSLKEALNAQVLQEKLSHGGSQQLVGLVLPPLVGLSLIGSTAPTSQFLDVQPVTV